MQNSLNEMPDDFYSEIKELSAVFFTPDQIADILEINRIEFIDAFKDQDGRVYKAFYAGRMKSEFELRRSVMLLATRGSSPAQAMAMEMLKKSELKMM